MEQHMPGAPAALTTFGCVKKAVLHDPVGPQRLPRELQGGRRVRQKLACPEATDDALRVRAVTFTLAVGPRFITKKDWALNPLSVVSRMDEAQRGSTMSKVSGTALKG